MLKEIYRVRIDYGDCMYFESKPDALKIAAKFHESCGEPEEYVTTEYLVTEE